MIRNVGGADRMFRIFFGATFVALAIFSSHELAVWGWLGLIPLVTGVLRWCPVYLPFGLSSYRKKNT